MTPAELAARMKNAAREPARLPAPRGAQPPQTFESLVPELTAPAVPPKATSPTTGDLSASLPPRTALLKVIMTLGGDQDAFQLQGYFGGKKTWTSNEEDLKHQRRPGKVLSRDVRPDMIDSAVEFYHFLLNWSIGKEALKEWIATLPADTGDPVRLIIWDDTCYEIPWELFQLDPSGAEKWLGVAFQVIRWTTVHDVTHSGQFSAVLTQPSDGRVLYYEDPELLADAPKYAFEMLPHPGLVRKDDMKKLLTELADESNRYGLIYVRAHGVHSDSLHTATLAGVRLDVFAWNTLPALRESRAVVFLNACHSATPVHDTLYDINRSFAEEFLRRHASAVIATLAEVSAESSWGLANSLLTQAHNEGVNVPEFLQRRRARYFRDVWRLVHSKNALSDPEDLTDDQKVAIQGFVHVCAFTYFGHPEAVLRLGAL